MATTTDVALLILRLVAGLTMAAHGVNKVVGGGRISGTAAWFASIGMKYGRFQAVTAATAEIAAGLGLALGLFTPIAAAGFVALMTVAAWTVHRSNGFFVTSNGWEYNLVLATVAVAIAMIGPGYLSLDHQIFCHCWQNGWPGLWISVGLGIAGAVGQLVLFYRRPVESAA